jgi:hypothetical protein
MAIDASTFFYESEKGPLCSQLREVRPGLRTGFRLRARTAFGPLGVTVSGKFGFEVICPYLRIK